MNAFPADIMIEFRKYQQFLRYFNRCLFSFTLHGYSALFILKGPVTDNYEQEWILKPEHKFESSLLIKRTIGFSKKTDWATNFLIFQIPAFSQIFQSLSISPPPAR